MDDLFKRGTTDISLFSNATKIFLHSVTDLRHSANGLLHTRTHLEVFTTEVGLALRLKKNDKSNEACFSLCLTIFWQFVCPSVLPSVGRFVHQSTCLCHYNHVATELASDVSENCTTLAALLEFGRGLSQGLYLRRTT